MEKMDMRFYRKLPTPKEVKEEYPVSKKIEELKAERDEVLKNIFEGKDGRCLLVIGLQHALAKLAFAVVCGVLEFCHLVLLYLKG